MSDARSQLPQGHQPVSMGQLVIQLPDQVLVGFFLAQVTDDAHITLFALSLDHSNGEVHGKLPATGFQPDNLAANADDGRRPAISVRMKKLVVHIPVRLRHQDGNILPDGLLGGALEHSLRGVIKSEYDAVIVADDNGVDRR